MASYIDVNYYTDFSGGTAPTDFVQLANISSTIVNAFCGYAIGETIEWLGADRAARIREATATQVAYLIENGGMSALLAGNEAVETASIGKFSYSMGDNTAAVYIAGFKGVKTSPLLEMILFPTGLLYRGVLLLC